MAAAYREPDLAEELDRADEAAETDVDEKTPSPPTTTTTAECPRQFGSTHQLEKSVVPCEMAAAAGESSDG